ncbi:gas vesicle protein [Streptomyces sp. HD1123-B1]|uniref:gas vesicle protein GvpO n=1 Tax=Streptomyces huangiella TaxID=3228804 RepID=UPI003D7C71DA
MPREQRRTRGEQGREREPGRKSTREPDRERKRKPTPSGEKRSHGVTARDAAQSAARQVRDLTGRAPEGVTSLERREDSWVVGIEVVETHRVPDSTDILAEYRVEVDDEGELLSYRRDHRYYRGRSEEGT